MDNIMQVTFKNSCLMVLKGITGGEQVGEVHIGNKEAYSALVEESKVEEFVSIVHLGDKHPAHPDPYTTIVLTEEWAKSFAKVIKQGPKPLFIPGHTDAGIAYKARAIPDGYVTGSKVQDNKLFLRNTMVLDGTRDALINQTAKEIKAKMLSTSTSDYIKYKTERNEDADETIYFAIESVGGQSNALVEADMTGSDTEIIITSFKAECGQSGKQGEKNMDKDKDTKLTNVEMFTVLKNQLDSGRLALAEVATSLGIDVMTSKQKAALKRLNDVESIVGDIAEYVKGTVESEEATFSTLKETKLKGKFVSDELIEIATPLFALKKGSVEEIDAEVKRISELKVFKVIQGANAGAMNLKFGNTDTDVTDEESQDMEA